MGSKKIIKTGQKYEEAGKIKEAFTYFMKATQEDPKNTDVWLAYGDFFLRSAKRDKTNKMDLAQKSLNAYIKSMELGKPTAELWNNIGLACLELEQYKKAIDSFEKSIKIEQPKESEIWENIGKCYEGLQDWEKTIEFFEKAIKINSNNSDSLVSLGKAYIQLFKWKEATNVLKKATSIVSEEEHTPWFLLGISMSFSDDFNGARNALEHVLKLRPKMGAAWEKLGNVYINIENKAKALYCYEKGAEFGDITAKEMAEDLKNEGISPEEPDFLV